MSQIIYVQVFVWEMHFLWYFESSGLQTPPVLGCWSYLQAGGKMKLDFLSQPLVAGGPGEISCSKNQIILDVSQSYWGSSEAISRMLRRCGSIGPMHFWKIQFHKYTFGNTPFRKIHFQKIHFWKHSFGKYMFRKYTLKNTLSLKLHFQKIHFCKIYFWKIHFQKYTFLKYAFRICVLYHVSMSLWSAVAVWESESATDGLTHMGPTQWARDIKNASNLIRFFKEFFGQKLD